MPPDEVEFDRGARTYRCIASTVSGPYLPTPELAASRRPRARAGVPGCHHGQATARLARRAATTGPPGATAPYCWRGG